MEIAKITASVFIIQVVCFLISLAILHPEFSISRRIERYFGSYKDALLVIIGSQVMLMIIILATALIISINQ